jgi:hypothetical protein
MCTSSHTTTHHNFTHHTKTTHKLNASSSSSAASATAIYGSKEDEQEMATLEVVSGVDDDTSDNDDNTKCVPELY